MVAEELKNNAQVFLMLLLIFGIDQDVVDENHDELIKFRHEYRVHKVHKVSGSICETEGHNQILIKTISG